MKNKIILITILILCLTGCYNTTSKNINKNTLKPTNQSTVKKKSTPKPTIKFTVKATQKPKQTNILISGFMKRPIINGFGDKKIGEYGYKKISKEEFKSYCTDEILIDFAKFIKKQDLMYVIIDFSDGTGLHGIGYSTWYYCKISKDKNGCYTNNKDLLSRLYIYLDTNKVDRSDFNLK